MLRAPYPVRAEVDAIAVIGGDLRAVERESGAVA
jgi:hypothetical protein